MYRLSWETIDTNHLFKYCNADPIFYSNTQQTVPNSLIPDEEWHAVSKETDDPWDQFRQLKQWADEDREFIRKVKLEVQVTQPVWEEVTTA